MSKKISDPTKNRINAILRSVFLIFFSVIAFVLVVIFATQRRFKLNKSSNGTLDNTTSHMLCHVEVTLMALENGGDFESFECVLVSAKDDRNRVDMSVSIDLPSSVANEHRTLLDEGLLYLSIPGGYIEEEYVERFGNVGKRIVVPDFSQVQVVNATEISDPRHHKRHQRQRDLGVTGTRSVLVFRVTTDDASPEIGATEIEERMFSTTQFSFAHQFEQCTFGEISFEPYDAQTPVNELYVPGDVASFTERTILNAATSQASDIYGSDIWDTIDHAIFCMPAGTSGKPYIAYSGVGSFFSVFHNVRCAYPTTVMHEIAHNCGLGHAFEQGEEYGDETSIMGFSSSSKEGPKKCFNGHNYHLLGLFGDRAITVDPSQGHQLMELSPFVDYDQTYGYQAVLISVYDMHLVYNRAKGFNAETSEYQDKVTITREENGINSELLAVMDMSNPSFSVTIAGSGKILVVELCESVVGKGEADYYTISIGFDFAMCPGKAAPSSTPTITSTSPPTTFPTSGPVTFPPSPIPTKVPSGSPSGIPTTTSPTVFPTPPPTNMISIVTQTPPGENDVTSSQTQLTSRPTASKESQLPLPTLSPSFFIDNDIVVSASLPKASASANRATSAIKASEPSKMTVTFAASTFVLFVGFCLAVAYKWSQRRLEERRRNLMILQSDANCQTKLYMQDPI